jgi:hypothetical protein
MPLILQIPPVQPSNHRGDRPSGIGFAASTCATPIQPASNAYAMPAMNMRQIR